MALAAIALHCAALYGIPAPADKAASTTRELITVELARRRGQQGVVELLAHVDEQGRITDLRVQRSSDFPLLDEAALKGVRAWTFIPATRNGTAVKGTALVPVAFELR